MIVAVSLSPALDVTYRLTGPLVIGATNRVGEFEQRPGGKALNVARVLRQLGHPARAVAALGGQTGAVVAELAQQFGIDGTWVRTAGETRRTIVVWDESSGSATTISEPGPMLRDREWGALVAAATALLPASALVIAGNVARGVPGNGIAELVALARRTATPAIVDTSSAALHSAIDARATIVKPNRDELSEILGRRIGDSIESLASAAAELRAGRDVAVVAGLAAGLAGGPQRLRLAAALGAAAARQPVAGEIGDYHDLYNATTVEAL